MLSVLTSSEFDRSFSLFDDIYVVTAVGWDYSSSFDRETQGNIIEQNCVGIEWNQKYRYNKISGKKEEDIGYIRI